jgi:poly-gamma-glutamate capsule biosynthesis protein CapA/YwtB (metallophosphatase superfamily)
MPAMPRLSTTRLPLLIVVGLLVLGLAVPMTGSELGFGGTRGPSASPAGSAGSVAGLPSATPAATAVATPEATPAATPTPVPTPAIVGVPIVPVTQFRATYNSTNGDEVAAVLAGTSRRYDALTLVEAEADAILAALGATRPTDADRLVLAPDAARLSRDLAKNRKRLAFLRADDVTPAVRALGWAGRYLFGVDRRRSLAEWRLMAQLPQAPTGEAFDPAATWTLFAGGDILLDRGVYQTIRIRGKGVDFPFDGGTAEITSRCKDCSAFGWDLPRTRRTGNEGAMRQLISGADIAIANFENPAPNVSTFHTSGTRFTADPRLIPGLKKAGIDYVSLANNHIGDAGDRGILQTIANLRKHGLKYSGAGKDLAAARKPAVLEAGGTKVAILGYDAIARVYFAGPDEAGSSQLSLKRARVDIKKAREAGADLVIVFPHWGTEYRNKPFAAQQQLARDIIDAGADMIIGNHAHWVGAVEVYKGKPIWYALGNFVFDQTWSEPTMEGITLELTFQGAALRQIRMRPHIILDKAQPNFLDPAGDGKAVLGPMYDASKGLLPY